MAPVIHFLILQGVWIEAAVIYLVVAWQVSSGTKGRSFFSLSALPSLMFWLFVFMLFVSALGV